MTEGAKPTQDQRKQPRGSVLGQFIAAQRLQGAMPQGQGVQGQGFNIQGITQQVDRARGDFQARSGWQPGFFASRFQMRQAERLKAVTSPRIIVAQNPGPQEVPAPPPPALTPVFKCPWENCGFESDSASSLQQHIVWAHQRSEIKSY